VHHVHPRPQVETYLAIGKDMKGMQASNFMGPGLTTNRELNLAHKTLLGLLCDRSRTTTW